MAAVRLTDLLPTNAYLLPYALSLFFASLTLTFAGAFLTLDRSRSFAPVGDVPQDRQQSTSRLIASFIRGGVGSILIGFVFASKRSPFSSYRAVDSRSQLILPPFYPSSYQALLRLKFSNHPLTCLFGYSHHWSHQSLQEGGNTLVLLSQGSLEGAFEKLIDGPYPSEEFASASIGLAVSVTIHPSLVTRIALVAVFAPTLAILTPLPIARLQPILLRISASAVGSFGLVLSIALFSRIEPWSNVWERLWVRDDIRWGSAQEKGLSAGFFLFLASGIATDWWLKFKFGENPDQVRHSPSPIVSD